MRPGPLVCARFLVVLVGGGDGGGGFLCANSRKRSLMMAPRSIAAGEASARLSASAVGLAIVCQEIERGPDSRTAYRQAAGQDNNTTSSIVETQLTKGRWGRRVRWEDIEEFDLAIDADDAIDRQVNEGAALREGGHCSPSCTCARKASRPPTSLATSRCCSTLRSRCSAGPKGSSGARPDRGASAPVRATRPPRRHTTSRSRRCSASVGLHARRCCCPGLQAIASSAPVDNASATAASRLSDRPEACAASQASGPRSARAAAAMRATRSRSLV